MKSKKNSGTTGFESHQTDASTQKTAAAAAALSQQDGAEAPTASAPTQRWDRLARIARRQRCYFDTNIQAGAKHNPSPGYRLVATEKTVRLALRPSHGALPYGWVRFEAQLRSSEPISQIGIRLCWNEGTSGNTLRFVVLHLGTDGHMKDLCFIDPSTQKIWLEMHCPMALQFELVQLNMQEMLRQHALLKAGLTTLQTHQLPLRVLPKKFWQLTQSLHQYGIAGTMAMLRRNSDDTSLPYPAWDQAFALLTDKDRRQIVNHISHFERLVSFTVVLSVDTTNLPGVTKSIESVMGQIYQAWQLLLVVGCDSDATTLKTSMGNVLADKRCKLIQPKDRASFVEHLEGDYVIFIDTADTLRPHALYLWAEAINASGPAAVLYADEEQIDVQDGLPTPIFKPNYSQKFLRSYNYIGRIACYRRALLQQTKSLQWPLDEVQHYRVLLETIRLGHENVVHVPTVMYATPVLKTNVEHQASMAKFAKVVQEDLDARQIAAKVSVGDYDVLRTHYLLPDQPARVSILIPTRDGVELLRMCIESIFNRSAYPHYEIIVVDNQSQQDETHAYFQELKKYQNVRVVAYDAPFNYSAINNFAAEHATGDVLCLLNNDIEVLSENWMEEMLGLALQPEVGAVGAKLFYPDHTVQHAGVVLGIGGVASHANRNLPANLPGAYLRAVATQEFSAVTAACLMIRKETFDAVGGLDPAFEIAYNDVDFCLRVQELGLQNVWTPDAKMVHHESATRGMDVSAKQKRRANYETNLMSIRWGDKLEDDPFYNPNLTVLFDDFRIANSPRWKKPWLVASAAGAP